MAEHTADAHHINDGGKAARADIYKMTILLSVITTAEFIIAFTMPTGGAKTGLFIVLTIVKAWGIVATFMHLKHEVKRMAWVILLPFLFIVWLLIALGKEGDSYGEKAFKDSTPTRQKVEVKHGEHGGHTTPADGHKTEKQEGAKPAEAQKH